MENSLSEILIAAMHQKGLTVLKLSQIADVPERVIELLIAEDYGKLPAAPYVRGYLMQISRILTLDGERLWQNYLRDSNEIRRSGGKDELPRNRFVSKKPAFSAVLALFVLIGLMAFFGFRIYGALSEPTLAALNVKDLGVVSVSPLTVSGRVSPNDTLLINEEKVYVDENGVFEKELILSPGLNSVDFKVKRFLGRGSSQTIRILYEPPLVESERAPLEEGVPNELGNGL